MSYTKDIKVLKFIYARLLNVHEENNNYDYMINFRNIINKYSNFTELLEACKEMREVIAELLNVPEFRKPRFYMMKKQAEQAIAKAEGK